ncbi:phage tail protein [Rubrivivax gelatinosus]|uniref:Oxidoreductase n=1 Tax=Rubrivivax gelatinosus TaxID=28068 RepID=A0ABS1DMP9_RUBGE|nr:phage tail protein [Rubrivivax gelatinosus]MBK1711292.1 oxidoreductase [Rubrivivax gelatinosus]
MMMGLGQFVFSLQTLAYQELQRRTAWRHASNARVGARAGRQYVGPGDDTITLSGVVVPEFAGKAASLDQLREMANSGKAWPLVDGAGRVFGAYVIEDISETRTLFTDTGVARRIEFGITLQRFDDDLTDSIGQRTATTS